MTRRGWLLFAAISVLWGIPYLFIKIAVREVDPSLVVCARVGLAALVLLPIAAHRGALRALRGRLRAVAALAVVQIAAPFLLISYGELHITSSLTSLLIASEPLLVALFALRVDPSERVRGSRLIGLLIGALGVATLFGIEAGGDRLRVFGAGAVLLATACYAASALLLKRQSFATLPGLGVITFECIVTSVLLLPLAALRHPAQWPDARVLASLLVLGLLCTALAELTFFALIAEVGAGRGTVFTYINPVVAVILGVALAGEPIRITTIAGFLLILLGSWFSTGT